MPKTHQGVSPALDSCFAAKVKQEVKEEELDSERAQEKDRLTNVLGLVKTVLLPRLGNLIGWTQKNRLRKPKPTNYSLISPSTPHSSVPGPSSLPAVQALVSPVVTPDVFLPSSGVRRSSRTSQGRSKASEAQVHQLVRNIKTEQVEPALVGPEVSDPPLLARAKRQRKPPNKLRDSGFLFSVGHPAGGATAVMKKEEEEDVDICLTSLQRPQRTLRTRRAPATSVVKREREERSVSQKLEERLRAKSQKTSRRVAKSDRTPAGRAGSKQQRGLQSQTPRAQNLSHSCLQCEASYQDCDALVMHRLRHIQGKHWPCPVRTSHPGTAQRHFLFQFN